MSWTIRPLGPDDADALLPLRLEALRSHPEAFGADVSEEGPAAVDRLIGQAPSLTLGGFAGSAMVGMAGVVISGRIKTRHKGHVWGFYVTPAFRGSGLSRALMGGLVGHAREQGLLGLTLTVTVGNEAARRLYAEAGFVTYGVEPAGLQVGGRLFDVELMALDLPIRG
ncbi:MAG TPA: GNAT family N-acetyltransferase [Rhodopila sp.]|nr:GNAT family N-acetyltransferase [Rhodopila sp.]